MRRAATTITAILGGIAFLLLTGALLSPSRVVANATDPPTGKTGAPGTTAEKTCIECHSTFTENDGVGHIVPAIPPEYTPGAKHTLVIAVDRVASLRWGFEITALDAGGNAAGTFTDSNPSVGKQTANGREYIGHTMGKSFDGTFAGLTTEGAGWSFDWTAPPQGTGTVTFYFSGVTANNDNSENGDYVYSGSFQSTEGAPTDVENMTWGKIKTIYR